MEYQTFLDLCYLEDEIEDELMKKSWNKYEKLASLYTFLSDSIISGISLKTVVKYDALVK